ncbi:MAG TPA: hypothetical protein VK141_00275 [Nitrosomonas sp.]|nr:hypothetical protein [Nitrosomonas sp.]
MKFSRLSLGPLIICFMFLVSCAVYWDYDPESALKMWKDRPETSRIIRSELTREGYSLNPVSEKIQILSNSKGCEIYLNFNGESKLISYERKSDKNACMSKVRGTLSPQ